MDRFKGRGIHIIQLLVLSLFIIITAISLKPIIRETDRRMSSLQSELISVIEDSIDYEISYTSISPSIFSYISIKDLIIYKDKENNEVLVRIKSLKAFYSPFYFFKKNATSTAFQAVKRFNINNVSISINQQRDAKLLSFFSSSSSGTQSDFSLLPLKTILTGKNIELNYENTEGQFQAKDLSLSLIPENGSYKTRIEGDFSGEIVNPTFRIKNFYSKIIIRGTIAEYFDSLNVTLKTRGFTSDLVDLLDQSFQLFSNSDELLIRKVEDKRPIDLSFRYDRKLEDVVITFNAEDFQPDSIIQLKDSFATFAPYTSSVISGNGSLLIGKKNSTFLYSLNSEIELNKQIFNREITVKTDFTGDKKDINVRSLDVEMAEGKIIFTGDILTDSFFPSGRLTLKNMRTPYGYTLDTTFEVKRDTGFLYLTTKTADLGLSEINNIEMVVFPDNKMITSSIKAEIIDENGLTGEIVADSLIDFTDDFQFKSFIKLSQIPMRGIVDLLPGKFRDFSYPEEVNDLSLYGDINIESDFKSIEAQINKFLLVSENNAENQLSFSAFMTDGGFKVNDLYLNWGKYNLNGYINSDKSENDYIITTLFDLQDKPYRVQAVYSGDKILFEGDYGIYGFFQNLDKEITSFTFRSDQLPIPVSSDVILADFNINGYFSRNDWKIYLNNTVLKADNLNVLKSPQVELTAELDQSGCNFYNISYSDASSSLKGLGRLTYESGDFSSWISLLDENGGTDEKYDLFISRDNGEIESRLSVVSTPVGRFDQSGLSGRVSFDLIFRGTMKDPYIDARISSDHMVYNGNPVTVRSFLKGNKDVIRVSDLELSYSDLMLNRGLILLEMNKGKLLATAEINQNINNSRASSAITAMITADNSFDIFTLNQLNTSQLSGKITTAPVTWDNIITFPQLDIKLTKDGSLFSAYSTNRNILNSRYNMNTGDISVDLKGIFPLRLSATGTVKNSIVDLSLRDIYFDPGFINYFMPTDPFKGKRHVIFNGGDVTGDLHVTGKISDPDFYGTLYLNGIQAESPYVAEIPEPASTTAYFKGKTIELDPLVIELNDGTVEAKASFEFDGALPTTYNVDVLISGSAGARSAYEIPKFSWDGHFTGFTRIEGNKAGGFLKGTIITNDLKTSLESSIEDFSQVVKEKSSSINGFIVDLTIQTGRDVNFYLPNEDVPIIQATADNGDSVNISYNSKSTDFELTGKVDIRTGEINYFSKTFYLQEGYIEFNETQVKFNPRLNIRADVETTDELGDDITISLLFDDYLMNEFKPEFLSFPSKSENEILALLGQSFIPSSDSENVSVASLLVATGGMVGKNTILHPFEEAIKSSLQLDLVSFNTNVIENAILDRLEEDDDYGEMNFAKYLEDTTLFMGEYIGEYLFLEGSLVVDYDESSSTTSTLGGLELLVNLNLQFITPFVLIEWSYNPKNNPDSDYFIPQNTISFTWRYSY